MNKIYIILFLCLQLVGWTPIRAERLSLEDCKVSFDGEILILENSLIQRVFIWNDGHIKTSSIRNKKSSHIWDFKGDLPDFHIPDAIQKSGGDLHLKVVKGTGITPAHIVVTVLSHFDEMVLKREFKLFSETPAIACTVSLKGERTRPWHTYNSKGRIIPAVIESLNPDGVHWNIESINFLDRTDDNNNLVEKRNSVVFSRQNRIQANLIFINEELGENSLFILKESPNSEAQINYPGCDFITKQNREHYLEVNLTGLNTAVTDLKHDDWVRCMGFVTGVAQNKTFEKLKALKSYQRNLRILDEEQDEMIMMNTWGDRSQDAAISEEFCLKEIKAAMALGITHFQIDDGWQTGRTANSAEKGGSLENIWNNEDYWTVDKARFPRGLTPVVNTAKESNIELGLWFNPSHTNDYANWKRDAETILNYYFSYGIVTYKIDGLILNSKKAEENFRSFLDTLMLASKNKIVINLDVTGIARRPGYHALNQYGNIFLENRYTDWLNYYPHWTLRNLWMLSPYVPAQKLQIEFLNKWRNAELYRPGDPLAPINIPFDYLFAITMMAQPLAWFEGSKLPPEALLLKETIKTYKAHMHEIHRGDILPIGSEPRGHCWTGFQSITGETEGYLLIFREYTEKSTGTLNTFLPGGSDISLKSILGSGVDEKLTTSKEGSIKLQLPRAFSYGLYKYKIKK